MTGYINWFALTQPIKGDVLNMEGNAVADYETVTSTNTSNAAPEGAQYASIVCSVDSTVEATNIGRNGQAETILSDKEQFAPAGVPLQIPNVIPGKTTITVTDV